MESSTETKSNEQQLFVFAMKQIDEARIDSSKWTIGGGTVLKEYLAHRYSEDIDIFMDDPQLLGSLSPRINDANDLDLENYKENANGMQLRFPQGKVDFVVAGKVTDFPAEEHVFHGRRVFFDDPVEIVAKKIFHRADYFHPRDCFDLACLYETERRQDLIDVGAAMPEKIKILKNRLANIQDNQEFFKVIFPMEAGQSTRGREFKIVADYIKNVEEQVQKQEIFGDLEKEAKDLHLVKSDSVKIHTKPNELIEYKGEILHVNDSKGYSVQKTGNSTLFVHKHENLERKPEVGEVLKIKYRGNEKGTIKTVERDHKKQQGLSR